MPQLPYALTHRTGGQNVAEALLDSASKILAGSVEQYCRLSGLWYDDLVNRVGGDEAPPPVQSVDWSSILDRDGDLSEDDASMRDDDLLRGLPPIPGDGLPSQRRERPEETGDGEEKADGRGPTASGLLSSCAF